MVGDRTCFDVVILDDNLTEYNEEFRLEIGLQNGSYHPYYSDSTRFRIFDNDGEYRVA